MDQTTLYRDIAQRCGGDIYIGVVGPVRTGKSSFIKRFMELMVLPGMTDENERMRARDELPQSGAGKTVMTNQPKFVPDRRGGRAPSGWLYRQRAPGGLRGLSGIRLHGRRRRSWCAHGTNAVV